MGQSTMQFESEFPRESAAEKSGPSVKPEKLLAPPSIPPGSCSIKLASQFEGLNPSTAPLAPVPPGMAQPEKIFQPRGGTRTALILVGDGASAPIEWWILEQRPLFVDPAPITPGTWATGIWIAPAHPGFAVSLDLERRQWSDGSPIEAIGALITGHDRAGNARWHRGHQPVSGTRMNEMLLLVSEYIGNAAGAINERGQAASMLAIKFIGCDRARLRQQASGAFASADFSIKTLVDNSSIELQRITPLTENCPR